jgi:hypothetical protein
MSASMAAKTSENFLFEKDGPVTTITFNRPERRNCMNREVMAEFERLVHRVRDDRETRVLIVTGTGAAFSAGADLSGAEGVKDPEERRRIFAERNGGLARMIGRSFDQISRLDCMTIGAINGYAVGGGWALATALLAIILGVVLLIQPNPGYIRLAHVGVHLHFRQVLGDQEDCRRLKRGRHGLADVHIAGFHRAIHRRDDSSMVQVKLRLRQCRFVLLNSRVGLLQLRLRDIDRLLGRLAGSLRRS